jgi:hypothetical protein
VPPTHRKLSYSETVQQASIQSLGASAWRPRLANTGGTVVAISGTPLFLSTARCGAEDQVLASAGCADSTTVAGTALVSANRSDVYRDARPGSRPSASCLARNAPGESSLDLVVAEIGPRLSGSRQFVQLSSVPPDPEQLGVPEWWLTS